MVEENFVIFTSRMHQIDGFLAISITYTSRNMQEIIFWQRDKKFPDFSRFSRLSLTILFFPDISRFSRFSRVLTTMVINPIYKKSKSGLGLLFRFRKVLDESFPVQEYFFMAMPVGLTPKLLLLPTTKLRTAL